MNKYKDRAPHETIRLAKDFLLNLGILVWESWMHDKVGLYTIRLMIDGTEIGVNGKGTTRAYALASAYGEMMERLQNMAYFRHSNDFLFRDQRLFRNQIIEPIDRYPEFMAAFEKLLPPNLDYWYDTENLTCLTRLKHDGNSMRCLQFKEYTNNRIYTIPIDLLVYYYTSNGMVAGNTPEEAYVQGLSEILERYAVRRCYTESLTPPLMDPAVLCSLENYEEVTSWINRIEETGRYKVKLIDLSLGMGIPVVGIILYDSVNAAYYIKPGAHPKLEIAVERCFTELIQGKNIENYKDMVPLTNYATLLNRDENILKFFIDGHGAFSARFFKHQPCYAPSLRNHDFISNREMQEFLVDLIHNMGYHILFYDCTVSDIYSYQFIVPGMSEIVGPNDRSLEMYVEKYHISNLIKSKVDRFSPSDAQTVLDFLDKYPVADDTPMAKLLMLAGFKLPNPYAETPVILLKYYLHALSGNYESGVECLHTYVAQLLEKSKRNLYIECLISFLTIQLEGLNLTESQEIISQFYNSRIVEKVIDDFNSYPLQRFKPFHCDYNCKDCDWNSTCLVQGEKDIYDKLALVMQETVDV